MAYQLITRVPQLACSWINLNRLNQGYHHVTSYNPLMALPTLAGLARCWGPVGALSVPRPTSLGFAAGHRGLGRLRCDHQHLDMQAMRGAASVGEEVLPGRLWWWITGDTAENFMVAIWWFHDEWLMMAHGWNRLIIDTDGDDGAFSDCWWWFTI